MNSCNPCDNGKCGSCIAEALIKSGFIRNTADHCGCAEKGHQNNNVSTRPKVKSMFSKVKDIDPHIPEPELIED